MICRINTGAKPSGAVYYNEDKVANGEARFLGGVNSIAFKAENISMQQKMAVLERYTSTNPRISKPTFHASLAFHPSEELSDQQLTEIGKEYMDRLGYGNQPYLVYRHEDTHHPHIHIVSVSVDYEGKRISDSHQHRRSNTIRQALEKEYGLVQAEKQGKAVLMDGLLPEQVLAYREPEAKKAIGNVVQTAMKDYRFSGIETFSAFLHQHRVQLNQLSGVGADGKPYRGITFQLSDGESDKRGQPIGPAIKASRFAFAPTMDRLEQQFKRGGQQSQAGQQATRKRIDRALTNYDSVSQNDFKAELRSEGVQVLEAGNRFVYVDHKSRNVYDEDELGEAFRRERWQKAFVEQSKLRKPPIAEPAPVLTTVDLPGVVPATNPSGVSKKPTAESNKKPIVQSKKEVPLAKVQPNVKVPVNSTNPVPERPISPSIKPVDIPVELTAEEEKVLARAISQAYQKLRTEGVPQNASVAFRPFYFESQLIAQFPHQHLTDTLVTQGVLVHNARNAVTNFETYKQSQLPDIRAKEQRYFEQTTEVFVKLAQQMPISAASRQSFLRSIELDLVGFNIRHRQNDALYYPLTFTQQNELHSKQGTDVPFVGKADKSTRSLYLAIAQEVPVPASVSYYQIKGYQLHKSVDAQTFDRVAHSLNSNYLTQVSRHLESERPLLLQLASRGIVVEKGADGSFRAGHTLSGVETFVKLDKTLSDRLTQAYLPPVAEQRQAQQTVNVRSLVRLSQAIDLRDEERILRVSQDTDKRLAGSLGTAGRDLTVHQRLQANLETLYRQKPPVLTNQTIKTPAKTTPVPSTDGLGTGKQVEYSAYGRAAIAMLLKTTLNPVERSLLASQLGLQWQIGSGGRVQVMERSAQPGFSTPRPGTVYALNEQEKALFKLPKPGEPVAERKSSKEVYIPNEEDRLVMIHQLAGRPIEALKLNDNQVARVQIQGILLLTESGQQAGLQHWYNGARGQQIIQQPDQSHPDTSVRRYLTDLYQRGFIVQRSIAEQKDQTIPTYRYSMGAINTPLTTHAALPDWLSRRMEQLDSSTKRAVRVEPTILIEGGWCDPQSSQYERMQRLARVLDSKQPTGVTAAVKLIHQKYPALREVTDTSVLLDALASQSTARLQQAKPLTAAATGRYGLEAELDRASRERAAQAQQAFGHLGRVSLIKAGDETKHVVGQVNSNRTPKPR